MGKLRKHAIGYICEKYVIIFNTGIYNKKENGNDRY